MQEWLVFSDYAPESNLIPTFVIVPFFKKFVFVFLNRAPETHSYKRYCSARVA